MEICINPDFKKCLKDGIHNAPKTAKLVAVHVSCCHMAIFYEYYEDCRKLEIEKGYELIDPQCYSHVVLVWDLKENLLLFYDNVGLVSGAKDYYEEHKNDPKPPPVYTPPSGSNWKNPLEQEDHFCQFDPGEDKCYFCGKPRPIL